MRRESARSPPLASRSAASVRSQKAAPGISRGLEQHARRGLRVVQEQVVEEAEVLPQPPVVGQGLDPLLHHLDALARPAGAERPRLAQEDGPVAVGDLEARVERRGDVDQRPQQLEALVAREAPLAPEVLDGAQPVDVGGQALEARHQALDVLAGPEVEHLLLRAEGTRQPVDARLAPAARAAPRAASASASRRLTGSPASGRTRARAPARRSVQAAA